MLRALPIMTLLVTLSLLVLAGCAKPPRTELASARQAVAQAYAAGAVELAGEDYQAAQAALRNAERLTEQGEYTAARDILSTAEAQARLATRKSRETRADIERQKLKQKQLEEQQRQRKIEAEKKKHQQPVKPSQPVKPAPPKPVSSYTVKPGETLWQISARPEVYDDDLLWPLLYKSNRDQITDPRKIYADQELTVPRKFSSDDAEAARKEARSSGIYPVPDKPAALQ